MTLVYVEAGYVNSGAVLPDQKVTHGQVSYIIVEGELSAIEVKGNERLSDSYLADRIRLAAGPPLNVGELQDKLRIMLDDPLIERIDAELLPGLRPGESQLRVTVVETPPLDFVLYADNSRQPSVGGEQAGGTLVFRNITGLGEILTVDSSVAKGFAELVANLEVPITPWDTRLQIRGQFSNSEVVEDPFDLLEIESESRELGIGFRQPLYRAPGQELAGTLRFDYRLAKNFLLGERFSFSEGIERGRSSVSVLRGVLEWIDRDQDQVIALRATTSLGLDLFGATTNPGSLPDGEFAAWLLQAQWVRRLGNSDIQLILRGETQLTPDRLLPLEKYSVGGINSVRGYREDSEIGDEGWNASIELQVPLIEYSLPFVPPDKVDGRIQVIPFFDAGRAWNNDGTSGKTLASIGAGLRWHIADNAEASIFYGHRLKDVSNPHNDLQDYGIHFGASVRF